MIQRLFTLILLKQDSDSMRSPSVFNQFVSISTTVVMNLPMWNLAWIKSESLSSVSITRGSPRKTFRFRLSRVTTNRIFTSRTDSIRRVVWWSGLAVAEFCGFSIGHRPGIAISGETLWEVRAFDTWGELLVPLELELSSPFGISSLDSGPFVEESGKISRGVLYDG
jgi:hypothetical protein